VAAQIKSGKRVALASHGMFKYFERAAAVHKRQLAAQSAKRPRERRRLFTRGPLEPQALAGFSEHFYLQHQAPGCICEHAKSCHAGLNFASSFRRHPATNKTGAPCIKKWCSSINPRPHIFALLRNVRLNINP
jgi:hypothetical protein